jgi:hypothetical protein
MQNKGYHTYRPKLDLEKSTPKKKIPQIKVEEEELKRDFIFGSLSREQRSKVLDPKIISPPVGFYEPNYSVFDRRISTDIAFEHPRYSNSTTTNKDLKHEKIKHNQKDYEMPKMKNKNEVGVENQRYNSNQFNHLSLCLFTNS